MTRPTYYLLGAAALLAMSCCRSPKPAPATALPAVEVAAPADSLPTAPVRPPAGRLDKGGWGWLGAVLPGKAKPEVPAAAGAPRKCKGCTFIVTGTGASVNVAAKNATAGTGATGVAKSSAPVAVGDGATATGKAKAPVATGGSRATDQSGTGAASAIEGNGNAPVLTNAPVEAPGVGATIAAKLTGPLGWVLGAVALAGVVYGIYYFWWLIPRRRKPSDTKQA